MRAGSYPVHIVGPERVLVAGSFETVNDAAPTSIRGNGFTVARTAEGVWTVTITDRAPQQIDAIYAWCEIETETDVCICQGDVDNTTASTFRIQLWVAPAPASPVFAAADEPGSRIHFMCVLKETGLTDLATTT